MDFSFVTLNPFMKLLLIPSLFNLIDIFIKDISVLNKLGFILIIVYVFGI